MTSAYIIQNRGETAGIVVQERSGVRFYASEFAFNALDNRVFKNIRAVHNAVAELQRSTRPAGKSRQPFAIAA